MNSYIEECREAFKNWARPFKFFDFEKIHSAAFEWVYGYLNSQFYGFDCYLDPEPELASEIYEFMRDRFKGHVPTTYAEVFEYNRAQVQNPRNIMGEVNRAKVIGEWFLCCIACEWVLKRKYIVKDGEEYIDGQWL